MVISLVQWHKPVILVTWATKMGRWKIPGQPGQCSETCLKIKIFKKDWGCSSAVERPILWGENIKKNNNKAWSLPDTTVLFFFLTVLEIKLRALYMLDKFSIIENFVLLLNKEKMEKNWKHLEYLVYNPSPSQ